MPNSLPKLPELPEVPRAVRPALQVLARIWRRIENWVFGLTVVLIALYFVLQLPFVQNWLIRRITTYLSTELQTTVHIGHVDLAFFDHLALEQLYLADQHGDTLLFAGRLTVGFDGNFFSALNNRLDINELTLDNTRIHVRRYEGEYDRNLQFLLDYFGGSSNKPKSKPRPFRMRVQQLRLTNVELLEDDAKAGRKMFLRLPQLSARVNNLDIPSKSADIESINIQGLYFDYEEHPKKPLPPRPTDASTAPPDTAKVNAQPARPFQFSIRHFALTDARVDVDRYRRSPERTALPEVIDFNHIAVQKIDFQADSLKFDSDLNLEAQLLHFAAHEQSGFGIEHAEARQLRVNNQQTALFGSRIETECTRLSDTIVLDYPAYNAFFDFNNKVRFQAHFAPGSRICLGDLRHFKGSLAKNKFLADNRDLVADLQGSVYGKVNNLTGRDLVLRLGAQTYVACDFKGNDLAEGGDRIRLSFDFKRLQSDMATMRLLVPGFKPSATFDRLGSIGFVGNYDFFFGTNHVLEGQIKTSIGDGTLNMKLDMTKGREQAEYSGRLNMSNFDLGAWTGKKDFGRTSFKVEIAQGSHGLTLPSVRAKLTGRVDTFYYRGYNYRNVLMDGTFSEKLFDGKLGITDPNVDFTFDGTVNLKDSIPIYSFSADLRRLDLGRLNLVDDDLIVSASVDKVRLTGRSLNDLNGFASVRTIRILQDLADRQVVHRIDSVRFESNQIGGKLRHFAVRSDVVTANVDGIFNLVQAPRNLLRLLSRHYPDFARQLRLPADDSVAVTDQYRFGLYVGNTRELTLLIDKKLDTLRNISLGGSVNGPSGATELYGYIPRLHYGSLRLTDTIRLNWQSRLDDASFSVKWPRTVLSKRNRIPPIELSGTAHRNVLNFNLKTKDTTAIVQSVDLKAALSVVDSTWQVQFNSSKFDLFKEQWAIAEDNFLRFGKGFVATQNFELMNGDRRILLDSINAGRGVKLSTANFDLDFLNQILPARGIKYRGKLADFDVVVGDVFKMKNVGIYLSTDTVFLNNTPYGRIDGNLELPSTDEPLEWQLVARDDSMQLHTTGAWLMGGDEPKQPRIGFDNLLRPGDLYSEVDGYNFPMSIVQQFVPGISQTGGRFDLRATVEGKLNGKAPDIGLDGRAMIRTGQFQIDYLKTMYHIRNQPVTLTDYLIWAEGDTILDATKKSKAIVRGGLKHNLFKDWRVQCEVASLGNDFLLLNTTKADNPLYYGKGVGRFKATFGGTFSRTDIKIDATTANGTVLYIPLTAESEVKEVNFIKFKPKPGADGLPAVPTPLKPGQNRRFQAGDLKGLSLEMNLTLTERAEVQLIFDEQAGDILTGHGEGDIALIINREGEFKIYGNYGIRRGEYLFTLLNFVNKPFAVSDGGTINWYGDPYGAQIDLDAIYDENTSVYNLLRDEISLAGNGNPTLVNEASRGTRTRVTMHMVGDLFKPTIGFDLDFPNVSPQLKSFTDNKLRLLRQDPNELNRQVFGLIVFGSFLPPDEFAPQTVGEAFSTVTQFVGSQLSSYLTGLASEWFGGAVSSIDINVAYNEYYNALNSGSSGVAGIGRDLQVRMTSGFANDRITIQIGSQFGLAGSTGATVSDGFIGEDVVIEIQPLENRQWRVKAYQRTEPDAAGGTRRSRYGIGVSFRKDFDSFSELRKGVVSWIKG